MVTWEQHQLKKKEAKWERDRNLLMYFVFIVVPYVITGCYSFNFVFRELENSIGRKEFENDSSGDTFKYSYNTIFYSMLSHVTFSMGLPLSYAFKVRHEFEPLHWLTYVFVPAQLGMGAGVLFTAYRMLPFYPEESDRSIFYFLLYTMEFTFLIGNLVFIFLAILMEPSDKQVELELEERNIFEDEEEEKKVKRMRKARKTAREWKKMEQRMYLRFRNEF